MAVRSSTVLSLSAAVPRFRFSLFGRVRESMSREEEEEECVCVMCMAESAGKQS